MLLGINLYGKTILLMWFKLFVTRKKKFINRDKGNLRGGKLKLYKSFLCHKVYQTEKQKFPKDDIWKLKKLFSSMKAAMCSFRKFLILEKKQKIISASHDKIQKTESIFAWMKNPFAFFLQWVKLNSKLITTPTINIH